MNIISPMDDWKTPIEVLSLRQAFEDDLLPGAGSFDIHQYDERKVVVTADRTKLFGVAKQNAQVIKHTDFIEILHNAYEKLFGPDEGEMVIHTTGDGCKINLRLPLPEKYDLDVGNGDVSHVYLLAENRYDRYPGSNINLGLYRLVCSNGAIAGKQIGNISSKEILKHIHNGTMQASLIRLIEDRKKLLETWKIWMDIPISHVAAEIICAKHFSQKFSKPLLDGSFPISKYNFYNLFTRRSTHDIHDGTAQTTMDALISSVFYSNKIESILDSLKSKTELTYQTSSDDEYVSELVTETDEIKH